MMLTLFMDDKSEDEQENMTVSVNCLLLVSNHILVVAKTTDVDKNVSPFLSHCSLQKHFPPFGSRLCHLSLNPLVSGAPPSSYVDRSVK